MKLIDKDALVAEIERRLEELNPKKGEFMGRPLRSVNPKTFPRESELEKLLLFLDTLEVKEVDLEKEVKRWKNEHGVYGMDDLDFIFVKHFFELGFKASNTLTLEDVKKIIKIHTDIYLDFFINDNGCKVDTKEYYQEVLKRFNAQKGE